MKQVRSFGRGQALHCDATSAAVGNSIYTAFPSIMSNSASAFLVSSLQKD